MDLQKTCSRYREFKKPEKQYVYIQKHPHKKIVCTDSDKQRFVEKVQNKTYQFEQLTDTELEIIDKTNKFNHKNKNYI